jgi:hypothetical protein
MTNNCHGMGQQAQSLYYDDDDYIHVIVGHHVSYTVIYWTLTVSLNMNSQYNFSSHCIIGLVDNSSD